MPSTMDQPVDVPDWAHQSEFAKSKSNASQGMYA